MDMRPNKLAFLVTCIQIAPTEDSDQTEQTDLNLRWVHMSGGTFSDVNVNFFM